MNAATKKDVRHWLLVFLAILAVVIPLAAVLIVFTYYAEAPYTQGLTGGLHDQGKGGSD